VSEIRNLWLEAEAIYRARGSVGLKEWEARLTPEQRLAMDAQWDQFVAGFREAGVAISAAAREMKLAVARFRWVTKK
jgi:hypothetical protein